MEPIHEQNGKWFFWDETWSHHFGPYDTREEAELFLRIYCYWLETDLIIF